MAIPVLLRVWLAEFPIPGEKPVTAPEVPVAVQENDVLPIPDDSVKLTLFPVHTLWEGGITETTGTGFTVTI